MSGHLDDKTLLDHAFELTADDAAREAASHLAECARCRERLEALKARLSPLDSLRGDIPVPERTVEETLRRVHAAPAPRRFPAWVYGLGAAAAAAAIVLGLVTAMRGPVPPGGQGGPGSIAAPGGGLQALRQAPPFAPASNIELTVLPRRDSVQLTVYNAADLTLVRDHRKLTMKKGWNWLQFMWAETLIDPTSLALQPLEHKDGIDVVELTFPPRLKELGRWLIFSAVSGEVPFEIIYMTSGVSWRAFYTGTLSPDEKTMALAGYVRADNRSGEDYENAQTRLVVGKIHMLDEIAALARRQYPYGRPQDGAAYPVSGIGYDIGGFLEQIDKEVDMGINGNRVVDRRKEIRKEGLSEYFIYTIEGTETIPNGWGKRLPSFEAAKVPVENLYKYDEERWGPQVRRFLSFANDRDHTLGETPIPDGTVRVYGLADAGGHLTYVGGTSIKYIPVDEEVELDLGPALRVIVEPKLMGCSTENHQFDAWGNISGWDDVQQWKITVRNTRPVPARLEVTRGFGTPYWDVTVTGGFTHAKHDATHVRFTGDVAPLEKLEFTYTVRTYRGLREERH